MLKFLRLNSLAIFLIVALPWLFSYCVTSGSYEYDVYISIAADAILLIWFLGLDSELMKRIPLKLRPSNTLFLINAMLLFAGYCAIVILLEPGETFKVNGIAVIPFFYIFYALFSLFDHLSKILTYAEEEKQIPLGRRIGEMVLFFFIPIGIWWLQPRIRKALEKEEITKESYIASR